MVRDTVKRLVRLVSDFWKEKFSFQSKVVKLVREKRGLTPEEVGKNLSRWKKRISSWAKTPYITISSNTPFSLSVPVQVPIHTQSTQPTETMIQKIARAMREHFGEDYRIVYLGPFFGHWFDAFRSLGRPIRALDVVKNYLEKPWDPTKSLRIPGDRDVVDIYPFGPGVLTLGGKRTVFVHYEFTPCIPNPLLCTLLSLGGGAGYVHVTSEPYDYVEEAFEEIKKYYPQFRYTKIDLGRTLYLWPLEKEFDPEYPNITTVRMYVVKRDKNNELLVRAGKLLRLLLSFTVPDQVNKHTMKQLRRVIDRMVEVHLSDLNREEREVVKRLIVKVLKKMEIA